MPKKPGFQNENKGRSIMQGRGRKASREEGHGNAGDKRQQIREERSDNVSDYRQQIREEGSGNRSDYRQQIRKKKNWPEAVKRTVAFRSCLCWYCRS